MPLKQRPWIPVLKSGTASSRVTGGSTTTFDLTIDGTGWEYTSDGDHQWPPPCKNARGDYGGDFMHLRTEFRDNSKRADSTWTVGVRNFSIAGHYPAGVRTFGGNAQCLPTPFSANQMLGYGATGWAQASPVKPDHAFGASLLELREGVPVLSSIHRMWKQAEMFRDFARNGRLIRLFSTSSWARREAARLLAGGYLTYEFDYKPFESDVRDLVDVCINSSNRYESFVRQGSKGTRRKRIVLQDHASVIEVTNRTYGPAVVLPTQAYSSKGTYTRTRDTHRKVWFSGSFLWPAIRRDTELSRARDKMLQFQVDYGLDLTPRTLWQVVPWSWLVDWTTNMGDCVSNLSDIVSLGLCCRHAYVMAQVSSTVEHSFVGCCLSDQDKTNLDGSQTIQYLSQQRMHALPFGFTFNNPLSTYSADQWAILAALGVSKGAHKL